MKNIFPTNKVEIVKLSQVSMQYSDGNTILNEVDFTFYQNQFYFLTGESGAGKTTFLQLLYKNLIPTNGKITIFGKDLATIKNNQLQLFRQKMGVVFQNCRLLDHLNTLENVALSLKINGMPVNKAKKLAKDLLSWVGLADVQDKTPQFLSDGQKQRVAIARAVITKPVLLLADEPTGNLDEKNSQKLMVLLQELNKYGTTIIMATHNRNLVHQYEYPELNLSHKKIIASFDNFLL